MLLNNVQEFIIRLILCAGMAAIFYDTYYQYDMYMYSPFVLLGLTIVAVWLRSAESRLFLLSVCLIALVLFSLRTVGYALEALVLAFIPDAVDSERVRMIRMFQFCGWVALGMAISFWHIKQRFMVWYGEHIELPRKRRTAIIAVGVVLSLLIWTEAGLRFKLDPWTFKQKSMVTEMCFSTDSKKLAVLESGQVKLLDLDSRKWSVVQGGDKVTSMAFDGGGRYLAMSKSRRISPGGVELLDMQTGQQFGLVRKNGLSEVYTGVEIIGFSANGRYLAVCWRLPSREQSLIEIWDTADWQLLYTIQGHYGPLAASPDGSQLVIRTDDQQYLKVLELATGRIVQQLPQQGDIKDIAYRQDGKQLLAAVAYTVPDLSMEFRGVIEVWDIASGGQANSIVWDSYIEGDITHSPDNKLWAAYSPPYSGQLWDIETGKVVKRMTGNFTGNTINFVYSPDGRYLAGSTSRNMEGFIKVWNIAK